MFRAHCGLAVYTCIIIYDTQLDCRENDYHKSSLHVGPYVLAGMKRLGDVSLL